MSDVKVWLCSDGDYSSYGITAVCSTQARADAMTARMGWSNVPLEWSVDVEMPAPGLSAWEVKLYDDGEVWIVWRASCLPGGSPDAVDHSEVACPGNRQDNGTLNAHAYFVLAADEKHAIKIANERRIQWIAAGKSSDIAAGQSS